MQLPNESYVPKKIKPLQLLTLGFLHENNAHTTMGVTDVHNDNPHLEKLIAGELQCWKTLVTDKDVLLQKQVVITDHTLRQKDELTRAINLWIAQLFEEKYIVYVWTGSLIRVQTLSELHIHAPRILPVPAKTVIEMLNSVPRSLIQIVDSFKGKDIDNFLFGKIRQPELNIYELQSQIAGGYRNRFLESIPPQLPLQLHISSDAELFTPLCQHLLKLPQINSLSLDIHEQDNLLAVYAIHGNKIKALGIRRNQEWENLPFHWSPNLQRLSLFDMSVPVSNKSLPNLPGLKEIDLNRCSIAVLNELLTVSKPVSLKLTNLYHSDRKMEPFSGSDQVRMLTLISISSFLFPQILNTVSALETLCLTKIKWDGIGTIPAFPALKKLKLDNVNVPPQVYDFFLQPGLEELTLEGDFNGAVSKLAKLPLLRKVTIHDKKSVAVLKILIEHFLQNPNLEIFEHDSNTCTIYYEKNNCLTIDNFSINELYLLEPFLQHTDTLQIFKLPGIQFKNDLNNYWEQWVGTYGHKLSSLTNLEVDIAQETIPFPHLDNLIFKNFRVEQNVLTVHDTISFSLLEKILQHSKFLINHLILEATIFNEEEIPSTVFPLIKHLEVSSYQPLSWLLKCFPNLIELQLLPCGMPFVEMPLPDSVYRLSLHKIDRYTWFKPFKQFTDLEIKLIEDEKSIQFLGNVVHRLEYFTVHDFAEPHLANALLNTLINKDRHTTLQICQLPEFRFVRNQQFIVGQDEMDLSVLMGFLQQMENTESLRIQQRLSFDLIKPLFERSILSELELILEVTDPAVHLADFANDLLAQQPMLKAISLELRQNNAFFILRYKEKHCSLKTNLALSTEQLFPILNRFPLQKLRLHDLSGNKDILLDRPALDSLHIDNQRALHDCLPALNLLARYIPWKLSSSMLAISEKSITLYGNQVEQDFLLLYLHLKDDRNNQTLIWHVPTRVDIHLPSMDFENFCINENFHTIELIVSEINMAQLTPFIRDFIFRGKEKILKVKNTDQQILFEITQKEIALRISGPRVTQAILNTLPIPKQFYLVFDQMHFPASLRMPPARCMVIHFNYCDVTTDFLKDWPANQNLVVQTLESPFFKSENLQNPAIKCQLAHPSRMPKTVEKPVATSKNIRLDNPNVAGITRLFSNDSWDDRTGEQLLRKDFLKKEEPWFISTEGKIPIPNYLRLQVDADTLPEPEPVEVSLVSDPDVLEDLFEEYDDDPDIFLSRILTLSLKKGYAHPLPALSPDDDILCGWISEDIDFYFCEITSLYYVASDKDCVVKLQFIVNAAIQVITLDKNYWQKYAAWFPCLETLNTKTKSVSPWFRAQWNALKQESNTTKRDIALAFCASFESKPPKKGSKKTIQTLVFLDRAGCCRHKKKALRELAEALEIEHIRTISNEIHAFAEIVEGDTWQMVCLGGALIPQVEETLSVINPCITMAPSLLSTPPVAPPMSSPVASVIEQETKTSLPPQAKAIAPVKQEKYYPNPFNHPVHARLMPAKDFSEACHNILLQAEQLPNGAKNLLIELDSLSQIEQLHAHMAGKVSKKNHYIGLESLQELRSTEIAIADDEIKHQMSHILAKTIQAEPGDVLFINISDYNASMVNTLNALFDGMGRKISGHAVSPFLTIIAIKSKGMAELEVDILSRFKNEFYTLPYLPEADLLASFCQEVREIPEKSVNFDTGESWQKYLTGALTLNDRDLLFAPGHLSDTDSAKPLYCFNLPLQLASFRFYLLNIIYTGRFYANGAWHAVHPNFKIFHAIKKPNLADENYAYHVTDFSPTQLHDFLLNRTTFFQFFHSCVCEEDNLIRKPGWIASHQETVLHILVTESLDNHFFAQLLDTASSFRTYCVFAFEPGISIPADMQKRGKSLNQRSERASENGYIVSHDMAFTAAELQRAHEHVTIIPVNKKTRYAELFEGFNTSRLQENKSTRLPVSQTTGLAHHLLLDEKSKQTVILQGRLSSEVLQKIQSLFMPGSAIFINQQKTVYPGKLILLTDEPVSWSVPAVIKKYTWTDYHAFMNQPEKADVLARWKIVWQDFLQYAAEEGIQIPLNFHQYQNMLTLFAQNHPNPFAFCLPQPIVRKLWPETKPERVDVQEFDQQRVEKLTHLLQAFPGVVIDGTSEAGKSWFVQRYLKGKKSHTGLLNVAKWVQEKGILFLDNIHLHQREALDALEGIWHQQYLLDGVMHPLDEEHRIIFAGNLAENPALLPFLQQFPILQLDDLPDAYLKDAMLLPVLQAAPCNLDRAAAENISNLWLTYKKKVQEAAPQTPWTPRNLESLLLRFALYRHHEPTLEIDKIAKLSIRDELENNLHPAIRAPLQAELTGINDWINAKNNRFHIRSQGFTLTSCRKNIYRIIQNLIAQESLKESWPALSHLAGFPGLLLEGPSGTGKSHTIMEALNALGFQNGAIVSDSAKPKYYFMSSEDNKDPQKAISQATRIFHAGEWLVIDELNTLPALINFLPTLLAGTDLSGKPADKPGFRLLATQNPDSFIGREKMERSFKGLFFLMNHIPEYSQKGLQEIAVDKGLSRPFSQNLASFFIEREKMIRHSVRQVTTRDFLEKVQEIGMTFFARLPAPVLEQCLDNLDEKDKKALQCTSSVFKRSMG